MGLAAQPRHSLANQRPSLPLSAPAFTHHVLLRIPNTINPRWIRHGTDRPQRWYVLLTRINHVINRCYDAFALAGSSITRHRFQITPFDGETHQFDQLASESFFADLAVTGAYRARLRVDINLETVAFTILIDCIAPAQDGTPYTGETPLQELLELRDRLPQPRLDDVFSDVSVVPRASMEDVWSELGKADDHCLIADVRFLVLPASGRPFVDPGKEAFEAAKAPELRPGIAAFLDRHGALVRSFVVGDARGSGSAPAPDGLRGTEAVVCAMLGGRALYASPLSSSPRRGQGISYLVVYDGESQAQLGRFVRRLHVMAELRLSALIDLASHAGRTTPRDLTEASQEIRRIGAELTEIETGTPDAAERAKRFEEVRKHFYALNQCSPDGIVFRIERSRYYADTFKTRICDLRIVRLEGWQPYDEFVRRYLYQLFDMISAIGTRYDALGRRIDRIQSFEVGRQIVGQTEQTAAQTKAATSLQTRGEDIAILAGLYYGYQLLTKIPAFDISLYYAGEYLVVAAAVASVADTMLFGRRGRERIEHWFGGLRKRLGLGKAEPDHLRVSTAPTAAIRSTPADE